MTQTQLTLSNIIRPIVIGLHDDEENQQKSGGESHSLRDGEGYGSDSGRNGFDSGRYGSDGGSYGFDSGRYGSDSGRYGFDSGRYGFDSGRYGSDSGRYGFGNQNFDDSNRGVNNKEYFPRKSLQMSYKSRRENIPPPKTAKLFEELGKYGW